MSDEEKQVDIKEGYTPPEPPAKPEKYKDMGHVPPSPPEKPPEKPPDEKG